MLKILNAWIKKHSINHLRYSYVEFTKKGIEYSLMSWKPQVVCFLCERKTGIIFNKQGGLMSKKIPKSKTLYYLCPDCFLKKEIITREELKFLLTYVSLL